MYVLIIISDYWEQEKLQVKLKKPFEYKKLAEAEAKVVQEIPLLDGEKVFKKLRAKYAK